MRHRARAETRLRGAAIGVIIIGDMHKISPRTSSALIVSGLLVIGAIAPAQAQCQFWYDQKPGLRVQIVPDDKGFLVDIWARDSSAKDVLDKLAEQARLDIIVRNDAKISSLNLKGVSPEQAIKEIAEAAQLSYRQDGEIYVIGKKANLEKSENNELELVFTNIGIRDLLGILSEQFGLKIEIAPTVSGELAIVHLHDETPASAVEKIARGARLSLEITKDGVYRVGFEAPKAE